MRRASVRGILILEVCLERSLRRVRRPRLVATRDACGDTVVCVAASEFHAFYYPIRACECLEVRLYFKD